MRKKSALLRCGLALVLSLALLLAESNLTVLAEETQAAGEETEVNEEEPPVAEAGDGALSAEEPDTSEVMEEDVYEEPPKASGASAEELSAGEMNEFPTAVQTSVPDGYVGIYTAQDIYAIRNDLSGKYIMMNDIDLTESTAPGGTYDCGNGWAPIQNFAGEFDGNGHRIIGMKIYGEVSSDFYYQSDYGYAYVGLFGRCDDALIKRLFLKDIDINISPSFNCYIGGIAGCSVDADYEECIVSGKINIVNSKKSVYVGGVTGDFYSSYMIKNAYNLCDINIDYSNSQTLSFYVGGLVGYAGGTIITSYNRGTVSENDEAECGAISARLPHSSSCYYLDTSASYLEGYNKSVAGKLNNELMKYMSSFVGFDSQNIWYIDPYCSYPYPQLRSTPQVRAASMTLEKAPDKVEYESGDTLDVEGGVISIEYEDGAIVSIPITTDMVSGYDMNTSGEQTVTVSYGGSETSYQISVKEVPVQEIIIQDSEVELERYDTYQINATIKPDNATDKTLTYATSNASIATVDQKGLVTAINPGTAAISVTSVNGTVAVCNVTVSVPVQEVKISESSISIEQNGTYQLNASVLPLNASKAVLSWSSVNSGIATVDQNG